MNSSRSVSGATAKGVAHKQIHPGDIFICYLTGLSRWCGVLQVVSEPYRADTGLYYPEDPYVIRFDVNPMVCLPFELAIPIKDFEVWSSLSFTRRLNQSSSAWTGLLRKSHSLLPPTDGEILHALLDSQSYLKQEYPLSARDRRRLRRSIIEAEEVAWASRTMSEFEEVSQLDSELQRRDSEPEEAEEETASTRESILMQAKVAEIGATMGFSVWVPVGDRTRVLEQVPEYLHDRFLAELNLGYDSAMLSTVRNIDVLWLRKNAIMRAFEIEHRTAVYSGLLRMADLLALQPNISIKLHIVADEERQAKALREITRPVFDTLELPSKCSFLSYAKVNTVAAHPDLPYLTDGVLSTHEVWA